MEASIDVSSSSKYPEKSFGVSRPDFPEGSSATVVSAISDDRTTRRLIEASQALNFKRSLPLCGRVKERDQLLTAFAHAKAEEACGIKTVIIRGPSGSGKSALVEKTFQSVFDNETTKGWFVTGKFDQFSGRNDPFSAIVSAITNLIDLIEHSEVVHLYENDVREAIKGNETTFACIIPNLGSITNRHYEIATLRPMHTMEFRQFISTFGALLSALSRREYPLVVFLDDLQWMDDATFELVQALVGPRDQSSLTKHLLLVGAIRSDDSWTPAILDRLDHGLGLRRDQSGSTMYIDVDNLDTGAVTQMISARLDVPLPACVDLGVVAHQKTMGSPFAVLRFLDLVASKGLLECKNNSWVWDESKIKSETNVSCNVLELVQQNMEWLPQVVTDLLTVASFLGYAFKGDTLMGLVRCEHLETFAKPSMTEGELLAILDRACRDGFVEKTQHNQGSSTDLPSYKFSHDKVQQAFYVSVCASDAQMLHRAIGLYLWNEVGEKAAIEVADHLNRTERPLVVPRGTVLDVNYAAAKLARSRKAYPLAAKYLRNALNQLGAEKWTKQYDLSLAMVTFLMELCVACGDSTEIDSTVEEVTEHGRCLEDKLPVMFSKVCFLGSNSRYSEAIAYGMFIIRLCGKTIPRNPSLFHIALVLTKVRRRAARLTDDDITELPAVRDKKDEYLMQLYSRIGTYATMMDLDYLHIYCALRSAHLSMTKGVSPATPMALVLFGAAEVASGNLATAVRFCRLGMRLAEEREMGLEAASQSYGFGTCVVLHWLESIDRELLAIPKKGMDFGLLGGELEFGYFSATAHFCLELVCGVPLGIVEQHAREACLKMKEFKVEGVLSMAKVSWQYILNLLGQSEYPAVLSGEAMNQTEHLNHPKIKESSTHQLMFTHLKFTLARLHGSYETAKQLATALDNQFKDYVLKSCFNLYYIKLNLALLWYHFARQSDSWRKKQKYLSKARGEVKFMKEMQRKGCPNFDDALHILKAEEASSVKNLPLREVQSLYDTAIASLSGKLHHEAIALEQAALYLIRSDDRATGASYMRRSVSKYMEWEAYAKTSDLVERFGNLAGFSPADDTIGNMTLHLPGPNRDSGESDRSGMLHSINRAGH